MSIQWYPGHMTKAVRQMREDLKLVDLLIEVIDARIPVSSRNPDIDEMGKNKYRVVLLNKADLAQDAVNRQWMEYFRTQGIYAAAADSRSRKDLGKIRSVISEACAEKKARDLKRGIKNRPVRAMIVGIPNSGKSTFINSISGKAAAKTGNKPGVTKGKQWIRLDKDIELLDTPGILWPKFEDETVGAHLAMVGSIRDEVVPAQELALMLIAALQADYPGVLKTRYGITDLPAEDAADQTAVCASGSDQHTQVRILTQIARSRNAVKPDGSPDYEKASRLLLQDFRSGRLGRISLEKPPADAQ